MKTLDDHNAEKRRMYAEMRGAKRNGIKCSQCGSELFDSNPGVVMCSNPPQTQVECPSCEFRGTRIV